MKIFETSFNYTGAAFAIFEMYQYYGMPKLTFQVTISAQGCKEFDPLSLVGFGNRKIFVFKEIGCGIEISTDIPAIRLQCDMRWLGIDMEAFVGFTLCMNPVPVSFYFKMKKLSIHQIIKSFEIITSNIIHKIPNIHMTDVMVAISVKDNVKVEFEHSQKTIMVSRGLEFHGKLDLFGLIDVENHFKLNKRGIHFKIEIDIYKCKQFLAKLRQEILHILENKEKEAYNKMKKVRTYIEGQRTVGWLLDLVRKIANVARFVREFVAWAVFSVCEKATKSVHSSLENFFTFDRVMFELMLQEPDQFKVAFEIELTMFNGKIPSTFSIGSSSKPMFNHLKQTDIDDEIMSSEILKHFEKRWNDYENGIESHSETLVNKCMSYMQEEKAFKQLHGEGAEFKSNSEEYQWIDANKNITIEDWINDYKLGQEEKHVCGCI